MATCSTMAMPKLGFPLQWSHRITQKNSPSLSSLKSRALHFSKGFFIPSRISGLSLLKHNAFSVVSSLVDNFSVDDAEASENATRCEIKTSTWKWRGYSIRYQHSGTSGPALVLVHGFGANRSTLLQFRFSSTI
ncbi:hypothetical protein CDL12_17608 [Handroanthus impetiginosus]|uniref:Chlorophyllase n=1 Tax=Handroanthus impetiginosus TaxID=429701 RepID=A0A2G9GX12_9LAMI|nr:hypothetical protein CDL12_17608 [Handroanthus impetiginosus]